MARLSAIKFLICALLLALATSANAQERVALVIGNSQYEAVPSLKNPENDATDIAASLGRLGFDVNLLLNLGGRETNRALRNFSHTARDADMAVLYFAGHGFEIDNQNYLIPVDAKIERAGDALYEAHQMSQFLGAVAGASTLRLVLLDACRNNPFLLQMADAPTRSLGRGLARIEPPGGVLVSYAAKGGTVAYDGDGRNSPYAEALLQHLEQPGLEIGKLFRQVRDSVYSTTGGAQEPFTYGSLPARDIFLAAAKPRDVSEDSMLRDFARADITNTVDGWSAFLDAFSGSGLNPAVIRRAHRKRTVLRQQPSGVVPTGDNSPLIKACDTLAADPDDLERPGDVAGVALEDIDTNAARQACVLATSGHPGHVRSLYQLGRVILSGPEPKLARPYLQQAADGGNVGAKVALASLILKTSSVLPAPREAIALLKSATESGSASAPRMLADLYLKSFVFLAGKKLQPEDLYRLAAERGDVPGMFEAGYRMLSSTSASVSEKAQGLAYLETAADAGNDKALIRLANHYFKVGGTENLIKARSMFEKAAQAGDFYANLRLVREHKSGKFWPRDDEQASRWLKYGADQGSSSMMVEYGYRLEIGRGVSSTPGHAANYYFEALTRGNYLPALRATSDWERETARLLQFRLRSSSKARYRGTIDGVAGAGTRAAMLRLCNCLIQRTRISFAEKFE